jgi:hypothetical protein
MAPTPPRNRCQRLAARQDRPRNDAGTARPQIVSLALVGATLAASLVAASFMMETTRATVVVATVGLVAAVVVVAALLRFTSLVGPLGRTVWSAPIVLLVVSALRLIFLRL